MPKGEVICSDERAKTLAEIEDNIFYLAIDYSGKFCLHLRSNGYLLAERWQALKQREGIE